MKFKNIFLTSLIGVGFVVASCNNVIKHSEGLKNNKKREQNESSEPGKNNNGADGSKNDKKSEQNESGDKDTESDSNLGMIQKIETFNNLVAKSIKNAKKLVYQPSDYYKNLEGKSGEDLIGALFNVQESHRDSTGSYAHLFNTYYDAFIDKYYENDGTILDIYSENPSGKDPYNFSKSDKEGNDESYLTTKYRLDYLLKKKKKHKKPGNHNKNENNGEGSKYNREHIIPQSWFSRKTPMRHDAHHVWPTDKYVNAKHSNLPFGTVKNATFTSKNGTKVGVSVEDGNEVTEVINEFKGDLARAILYFVFTYRDKDLTANGVSKRFFERKNNTNSIKTPFLKTMLLWSSKDPLTLFDIDRNNAIFKHQHNRNPFIDYPELIDVVFKNNKTYVFKNKGILIGFEANN
ncbi:ribonuclease [Mycoplasmopsis mucosicanis]|uniref:Ribonuclease n=1 Tax=Mycoplasmopsis mucosicanis TaxID=458208 RepID=A0A507SSS0_9BACT|nr:endonuclease [Mycoplasmopsis mucosicanis]TQC54136.1 ribonuclease [Mycoplasmopsis mucosicanis]